jgi:isocitrate/isopropylmalate dehydrogenase
VTLSVGVDLDLCLCFGAVPSLTRWSSFGAVGAPDVPDHISLWGLRLAICQPHMYANVRRTRILPGTESPLRNCQPGDLDWCIVRENSEGEYAGHGGRSHRGLEHEVGTGEWEWFGAILRSPVR